MSYLSILFGLFLLVVVVSDTFETIVVPRTVGRDFRLTRLFYKATWSLWRVVLPWIGSSRREGLLGAFGPLSLLLLFGLWANLLVLSFALLHGGLGTPVNAPEKTTDFGTYLYLSGVTFFTLGFGDVTPLTFLGRTLAVAEVGTGFGLLAVVISYLPVIYQSFSRREVSIILLDARAGSPPSAGELLARHGRSQAVEPLTQLLRDFERWSAELLESFISYPILAFYRSQHEQQSWLSTLTMILDTCALIQIGFQNRPTWYKPLVWQARLTFAMARHVVVDLAYILNAPPVAIAQDRLGPDDWARLCKNLAEADLPLCDDDAALAELRQLRAQYERFVDGLARHLFLALPPWSAIPGTPDDWQTSAWDENKERRHF